MKNEKKSFKHGKNREFEPRSQGNQNTYTQHFDDNSMKKYYKPAKMGPKKF